MHSLPIIADAPVGARPYNSACRSIVSEGSPGRMGSLHDLSRILHVIVSLWCEAARRLKSSETVATVASLPLPTKMNPE